MAGWFCHQEGKDGRMVCHQEGKDGRMVLLPGRVRWQDGLSSGRLR